MSRSLTVILPLPGLIQTRAVASLRSYLGAAAGCCAVRATVPRSRRSFRSVTRLVSLLMLGAPLVLWVHGADIQRLWLLGGVRMIGTGEHAQILHLLAAERAARHHALHRFHDR